MMTKTAYYMQMAQEAAAQITGSKEQWTAFLNKNQKLMLKITVRKPIPCGISHHSR